MFLKLFLLSTFISTVGNLTSSISLAAFMTHEGFPIVIAGITLSLMRYFAISASFLSTNVFSKFDPKNLIIGCELLGLILTAILVPIWQKGIPYTTPLIVTLTLRTLIVTIPTAAKAGLLKSLSQNSLESNTKSATYFNVATQGAALFSGVIAYLVFIFGRYEWVLIFDAFTFIVSTIILIQIPIAPTNSPQKTSEQNGFFSGLKSYFKHSHSLALEDIAWAITGTGATIFALRLAREDSSKMPLIIATYGLSVWVAGWLVTKHPRICNRALGWFAVAVCFLILNADNISPTILLAVVFLKDTSRWLVQHKMAGEIQYRIPQTLFANAAAAKTVILGIIFATGDWLLASLNSFVPISTDLVVRGTLAFTMGVLAINTQRKLRT